MTKDKYPYSTYIISGSQTDEKDGYFYFMKWYNMRKTKYDDDSDKGEENEDEEKEISVYFTCSAFFGYALWK